MLADVPALTVDLRSYCGGGIPLISAMLRIAHHSTC
jgi:hypothetical protein